MGTATEGNAALEALRWNWGDAYTIWQDDHGNWCFRRMDGWGGTVTAGTAEDLRRAIIDNYVTRPVERLAVTAELAERRDQYSTRGVRIWHDAAGWHARWQQATGGHTGVSHPCQLSALLDRLDALAAQAER